MSGPSTTWLWQRLARVATASPSAVIDMADLAARLGLGPNLDPSRAMSRTVNRPRSSVRDCACFLDGTSLPVPAEGLTTSDEMIASSGP